MSFYSFNGKRFQKSIRDAVVKCVGSSIPVIWSMQNAPRPERPYIVLDVVVEVDSPEGGDESSARFAPTDSLVVFTQVVPDKYYQLFINGFIYEVLSTALDTIESVRDKFFTLLDGNLPEIEIQKNDVDAIEFEAIEIGAIFEIEPYPKDSITVENFGSVFVVDTKGSRYFSISIDCYSDDPKFYSGAWSIANKIKSYLQLDSVNSALDDEQISLLEKPSPIIDLSAVFGAQFESRAQFEIKVNTPVFQSEASDYIESIQFELDTGE